MLPSQDEPPKVRGKVAAGIAKAAIGAFLVSFEFYSGAGHGLVSLSSLKGMGKSAFAACIYVVGFWLILSAVRNCPFMKQNGRPII